MREGVERERRCYVTDKHAAQFEQFGRLAFEELKDCLLEDGLEMDAGNLAALAIRCGLMRQVPYDPDKHGDSVGENDYKTGDLIYWWGE